MQQKKNNAWKLEWFLKEHLIAADYFNRRFEQIKQNFEPLLNGILFTSAKFGQLSELLHCKLLSLIHI